MSDVRTNLLNSRTKGRESICNAEIDLSRVRLGANAVALREPSLFAENVVQLVDLCSILENLDKRSLGALIFICQQTILLGRSGDDKIDIASRLSNGGEELWADQ